MIEGIPCTPPGVPLGACWKARTHTEGGSLFMQEPHATPDVG